MKKIAPIVILVLILGCGKSADQYMREGREYVGEGDLANAAIQFEKAVEVDPENHEAHNSLGAVLSTMGDFTRAISHFRLAVALNDSFIEGHYNLGRALAQTGEYNEALIELAKVTRLDSTYPLAYLSAGVIFANQGMAEQAIDSFGRAIRHDPNLIKAYLSLASVYIGLGEYQKGIDTLLEARKIRPGNLEILSMAGRAAVMNRDLDQAVALFLETTRRDSTNPICRNDLATALMLAERKDEAVAEWEKALTLNPDPSLEEVIRQNLERAGVD